MQEHSSATEQTGGKHRFIGKRKLSDQVLGEPQQRTIPELFRHTGSSEREDLLSPSSNKRPRPASPSPTSAQTPGYLISPEKMYSFPNSAPKENGSFGQQKSLVYSVSSRPSNFAPYAGARKLVVKNLRPGPRLNQDVYFEKVWAQLRAALKAIFSGKTPEASLEELYKGAENVCRQGRSIMLTKRMQEECKEYVSQSLRASLVAEAEDEHRAETLRTVVNAWTMWNSKLVCTMVWFLAFECIKLWILTPARSLSDGFSII
jgi:Cullin family